AFTLEHEKWLADEPEKDLGAIGFAGWPAYLGLGHVFLTSVFAGSRPKLSVAQELVGERSRPRPPRAWLAFKSDAGRAARSRSGKLRVCAAGFGERPNRAIEKRRSAFPGNQV